MAVLRLEVALCITLASSCLQLARGSLAQRRMNPATDADSVDGKLVQQAIDAAIVKGAKTFALPKGNVNFNASDFLVAGAHAMTIKGSPSTTLWFNVGAGMVRCGRRLLCVCFVDTA